MRRLLAALVAACAAANASAAPPRCARISWDGVAALFERWNQSLATQDAQQVAVNYAQDAVLLPAFANNPRNGRDAIRDYYAALLPLKPQGRVVKRTIKIRCNVTVDAGVVSLHLTDAAGVESVVPALYSFVYEYRNGHWLVAQDHASVIPSDDAHQLSIERH